VLLRLKETVLSHPLREVKEKAMKLMKLASFRSLLGISFLLLLAACADQRAVTAVPSSGPVPEAVDLGGSSRVPHVAGLAGEGEGYGPAQSASTDYAPMPGMGREASKPAAQTSMPGMDHSTMDHGSHP
jgi:hypothetical protein